MIAPLGGFGLRGMLWYQGESNTGDGAAYAAPLRALREDWRRQFGARTPLLLVQLAGYGQPPAAPADSGWAQVREAQRRVAAEDAQSGLAIAIDIGDAYDIHPPNKQELGRRRRAWRAMWCTASRVWHRRARERSPPCGRPRASPLRSRMSKARSPRPAHCVRSALNCARPGAIRATASTPMPDWMRAGSCCAARCPRAQRMCATAGPMARCARCATQRAPAGPFELPIAEAEARR